VKSRFLLLIILIISSLSLFAQVKVRYPTNVRYIAGNYLNQSPYYNNLLSALNNVKASATLTNPYVFQIDSDTLYISDWDSVYQSGGLSMIDSIEQHYVGKIKFSGVYGADSLFSIQDTSNFVSKTTTQVVSGTKWNTGPHYFKSGYKQYANSEVVGGSVLDFQTAAALKFTSGYLFLPQNAYPDDGNIHMDLTSGDLISYGTGNNDTLASQRWTRANYHPIDTGIVKTTTNQNVFGNKTLYGTLAITGTSGRFVLGDRTPTTTRELSANTNGIYFYNGASVDTLPSRTWTRTNFLDLNNAQDIGGTKSIYGRFDFQEDGRLMPGVSTSQLYRNISYVGANGTAKLTFDYGSALTDTLVTERWIRNNISSVTNSVLITGTQTVAGLKTFSTGIAVANQLTIPSGTGNSEILRGIEGNNSLLFYMKAGITGDYDTLLSFAQWRANQTSLLTRADRFEVYDGIYSNYSEGGFDIEMGDGYIQIDTIKGQGEGIKIASTMYPSADGTTDLGRHDRRYDSIYVNTVSGATTGNLELHGASVVAKGPVAYSSQVINTPINDNIVPTSSLIFVNLSANDSIVTISPPFGNGDQITIVNSNISGTTVTIVSTTGISGPPSANEIANGSNIVLGNGDSISLVFEPVLEVWIITAYRDHP